jgi:YVTN family beta-propeller protein
MILLAVALVFITNERDGTVSVIRSPDDTVVRTIELGGRPRGIQVSPRGASVFVGVTGEGGNIIEIEAETGRLLRAIAVEKDVEHFAVHPDGVRLYTARRTAGSVSAIDARNGIEIASVKVGNAPQGVAISPDGKWVYVTVENSGTVAVIDTATNKVEAKISVAAAPKAAASLDPQAHSVLEPLPAEAGRPSAVTFSPDGTRAYVANARGDTVSVIDTTARSVLGAIPMGKRCWGVSVTADGKKVYSANKLSNSVSVIDAETNAVQKTISVGKGPWGMAVVSESRSSLALR